LASITLFYFFITINRTKKKTNTVTQGETGVFDATSAYGCNIEFD